MKIRTREMAKIIDDTFDLANVNSVKIQEISDVKLNESEYQSTIAMLKESLETVRYATYDNFRVLQATDNYLEKYLPF